VRTLDPALIRDAASSFLARQVYSALLKLDERLEPAPDLAVAPPAISADRLTYTFTLRDGVLFHDGTPVTAEAVKASLERATDPRLAGGDGRSLPAATYLNDIQGVTERLRGQQPARLGLRVTGPRTLEITLAAPKVTFLVKLTHTTAAVVDVRQTGGQQWWKRPNGSGPFRLSDWRDGDRLVMARWDRYYDGRPGLERIVWLLGANASQPLNLYESGKIDLTDTAPTASIGRWCRAVYQPRAALPRAR
jgi:ABC-type transport system substrate-binding protein